MRSASSTADLKLFSGFSSGVSRITALPRSKPRRHWSGRGSGVYGTAVGDGGSLVCATASAAKQRIGIQNFIGWFLLRRLPISLRQAFSSSSGKTNWAESHHNARGQGLIVTSSSGRGTREPDTLGHEP